MFYMRFFNYTTLLLSATDLTVNVIPIPKLNHFFSFFLYVKINYIIYAM